MKSLLAATAKNIQLIGVVLCLLFVYSCAEERKFDATDNVNTNEVIPKYSYSYNVQTAEGDQHGHRVTVNGAYSKGKYYVKFADGSDQDVQYYADHLGYHPQVRYITTGTGRRTNAESDAARIAASANFAELNGRKTESSNDSRNSDRGISAAADAGAIVNDDRRSTDNGQPENEYKRQSPFSQQDHYRLAGGTELVEDATKADQRREQFETRIMLVNGADIEELIKRAENDAKSNGTGDDLAELRRLNLTDLVLPSDKRGAHSDLLYNTETNEISNGFLKKIVSVIPELYPPRKPSRTSSRPIVVTAPQPDEPATNASTAATGSDDALEEEQQSASSVVQVRQKASAADRQPHYDRTDKQSGKEPASTEPAEPKQPDDNRDSDQQLYVEPQFLQEQPVLTTTVEIQKSLPLIELDVVRPSAQDQLTDNRLTFGGEEPSFPARNLELSQRRPQLAFLTHPVPVPTQLVHFPFPPPTPPALIYNVPVPLKLFATPDDYLNSGAKIPSIAAVSNSIQAIENAEEQPTNDEHLFKENYPNGSPQNQPVPPPLLLVQPDVVPTSPTLKQNGPLRPLVSPLDVSSSHYDQQRRNPFNVRFNLPPTIGATNSLVRQLTPVAYRLPSQPINKVSPSSEYSHDPVNPSAALLSANSQKSSKRFGPPPFKPSHPMWDSIYPPQHVYYVPLVSAASDNRMQHGRSVKEPALSRRTNQRQQLRHLLIEYGGFKPPMIPSTLLSDVNNGQERSSR